MRTFGPEEGGRVGVGSLSTEGPHRQDSVVGSTLKNAVDASQGISVPDTLIEGSVSPWEGVFSACDIC